MATKPSLPFQPAPRPQPRLTQADADRLTEGTADLGFGRPSSGPEAPEVASLQVLPHPRSARGTKSPDLPRQRSVRKEHQSTESQFRREPSGAGAAIKLDVPGAVWIALKMEAINRRVTVRYLVLEALAKAGYEVDLAAVPEDGRRLR